MNIDGNQRPPDPPPPPPPEKVDEPVGARIWDVGDGASAAGAEAMERWEASEDRILQDNADYFDAEAQRYRDLGDHDAAIASQEAAERARSLIGDGAQPAGGDAPPGPTEAHFDSVGTGNLDRDRQLQDDRDRQFQDDRDRQL
jgi:hypothetical protein